MIVRDEGMIYDIPEEFQPKYSRWLEHMRENPDEPVGSMDEFNELDNELIEYFVEFYQE